MIYYGKFWGLFYFSIFCLLKYFKDILPATAVNGNTLRNLHVHLNEHRPFPFGVRPRHQGRPKDALIIAVRPEEQPGHRVESDALDIVAVAPADQVLDVLVLRQVEAEDGGILVLGVGEVETLVNRVVGQRRQVGELLTGDASPRAVAVEKFNLTLDGHSQV